MKRLLVIEDDRDLGRGLELALSGDELACTLCRSLEEARGCLREGAFDLILLDINLPDGSGLDFLGEFQGAARPPIILLTANDTELDVVAGLERGADDYITKPFSLAILRARIHAQLRRGSGTESGHTTAEAWEYSTGPYRFCFDRMEFFHEDKIVELSKTEQKLLRLLVEHKGTTLSRGQLVDRIWTDGAEYVDENALSVTVKRLRDKLDAGAYIKTVYGIGYTWREDS